MRYWLMKSEPDAFSIDDLKRRKVAGWDGVRNYQARNNLMAMQVGDEAFFYHSNAKPSAIVGRMEIVREAYPDPTQFDSRSPYFDPAAKPESPRWQQVDVRYLESFKRPLPLEEIRALPGLRQLPLIHHTRLSVQPVVEEEWSLLLERLR